MQKYIGHRELEEYQPYTCTNQYCSVLLPSKQVVARPGIFTYTT
jgi:hypothetical protein